LPSIKFNVQTVRITHGQRALRNGEDHLYRIED